MVKSKRAKDKSVAPDKIIKGQKAKRWKKGHSCATNPAIKKHRLAAKARLFSVNSGPSNLTVDALAKHEAEHIEDMHIPDCCPDDDVHSIGAHSVAKTNNTWASQWTECTNTTFNRVLQRFALSNLAQHKEVIAVLAAVSEEIKCRGGAETNTEYFAALMTIFDSELDEQSCNAVAYLLSVVIKKVPLPALRARFSDIARSLASRLGSFVESSDKVDGSSLPKSVIFCLSHLLSALDRSSWSDEYTVHVFRSLLPFVTSSKAKVRKAAHHAMGTIIRGSCFMKVDGKLSEHHHPAAAKLAKYCNQEIEKFRSMGDLTAILHVLELLKTIMSEFPENHLKTTLSQLLGLLDLRNLLLSDVVMKTLHSMFGSKPRAGSLSSELTKDMITKLYLYKPNEIDTQQMAAWLTVMEQAHCNWIRLNEKECITHLPDLFKVGMKCLGSGKVAVTKIAANVLITLLKDCIRPAVDLASKMVQDTPPGASCAIHKLFRYVEAGLGYQYMSSWDLVLTVLAQLFEVLGSTCHSIMRKCLASLAELRGCQGFEHKDLLDKTFGMAVRVMGPRVVLEAVPLLTAFSQEVDLTRSWLLPVLRDYTEKTELSFFATFFLPLAVQLKTKCADCERTGRLVELKTWSVLFNQIWSLLPGFCSQPTDLSKSFPLVAQTLGECISNRPDVRMEVLNALRKLCMHCTNDEEKQVMGRFAKNFLPILANLIAPITGEKGDASRLAALETMKCYLKVADKKEIRTFYSKCASKLSDKETTLSRKPLLMDMLIAFVPHLAFSELKELLSLVCEMLDTDDKSVEKKSFRILEEMCTAPSLDCKKAISTEQGKLKKLFLDSVVTAKASSTAPRLRFATYFLRSMDTPDTEFLQTLLPEALLSTKATGEKARAAAYVLIIEIGQTYMRWNPEMSKQDAVHHYVVMMMAGLIGNPQMVSCTLLALTKLVHDYKGFVQNDLLETLVDNGCVVLMSKAREVVQSALGFIKTLVLAFDTKLGPHLEKIISSLVSMKEDNRHHFRFKTKELFALLVRKFGFNVVYKMVPESLHKLFNNMRKSEERKERRKQEPTAEQADDTDKHSSRKRKSETFDDLLHSSDSEMDDGDTDNKPVNKKMKRDQRIEARGNAWLKEDEDIVDFLDPSAVKKVFATKPNSDDGKPKGKAIKHDFKMAADGRLIITDDSMQQDSKNSGAKADYDDIDELMDAAEGTAKSMRKRRVSSAAERDDYSELGLNDDRRSTATGVSGYRAGGKGIHRPLGSKKPQDPGKEYRAKKAGGDMKKAGKPDPYAYIPLEQQFLNKRKKAKAAGQFKHLVKGARKGALKGNKLHRKQKKVK